MNSGSMARLSIDLAALAHNYRDLAARAAPARCGAAVKANAYGIGLEPALRTLAGAGCESFFTATLDEAIAARAVVASAHIYVLNGLPPGSGGEFVRHDLRPVLGNRDEIAEWSAFARAHAGADVPPVALHIDTGMNRLGLMAADVAALQASPDWLSGVDVALVMSHLACADEPAHPKNAAQLQAFNRLRALLPAAPASLANSGGIFLGPDYHFDLVRPGIALYGGEAVAGAANPMRPVVRLEARIAQVRRIGAGETVGYGGAYTATGPRRIATIPVGYADGYARALGGTDEREGAPVAIGGRMARLAGRVSMDLITVDVTGLPEGDIRRGTWVELIGPHISIDDLARHAHTIGYEILTRLGPRHERVYLNGDPHESNRS
ncbi:MAG TPA: alanine racemase [Rhodobacteraceae bacterium]|nr:alanine racemase [Paracoccaceae bacterium]